MQKIQVLIITELTAQKDRLFLWLPFCLAVGIGFYFALREEPDYLPALILFMLSLAGILGGYKHQEKGYFNKILFLGGVGLFVAGIGFSVAKIKTGLVYTPMIVKKMAPVGVVGTIEIIEPTEKGSRAVLKELEIERLAPDKTPHKIRIKIRKDNGLRAGQKIKILAGLNPPSPPVTAGSFDFQFMAFYQGIGAVGFAYTAPEILHDRQEPFLSSIRQRIVKNIQSMTSVPEQAILVALMTGQRKAIREEDWQAMRESGLAHMLAISGLHVGMVAGVLFFFSRFFMALSPSLALRYPIKKWAAVIALTGACLYTLIVGATIPTQRALMMTGLVMVAILLDRSPFSLRLVAFAAFVILLAAPEALLSVSFQMSFVAVASLICFFEWSKPFWDRLRSQAGILRKIFLYLAGISATTLIAGTVTGLFALYHFGQYAAYGLLANLVAVPLLAFIVMPLLVLSYVLMPLGLSNFVLPYAEEGVSWILACAHWVAGMDGAVWRVHTWPAWEFIGMVLCLWMLLVWKGRIKYFILVPGLFFLIILASLYKQPDIQIANKVDLVSLIGADNKLWLSTGRTQRYTAENWLRQNGQNPALKKQVWPKEGTVENFLLNCDYYGCRGQMKGHKVSISFSKKATLEDCNWADLLISKEPVTQDCKAGNIIDFWDVWRYGHHAVWIEKEGFEIKSVESVRGNRPWTQSAARQKD